MNTRYREEAAAREVLTPRLSDPLTVETTSESRRDGLLEESGRLSVELARLDRQLSRLVVRRHLLVQRIAAVGNELYQG